MEDYYKVYITKESSHFNLKKLEVYFSFCPVRELSKHNIICKNNKNKEKENWRNRLHTEEPWILLENVFFLWWKKNILLCSHRPHQLLLWWVTPELIGPFPAGRAWAGGKARQRWTSRRKSQNCHRGQPAAPTLPQAAAPAETPTLHTCSLCTRDQGLTVCGENITLGITSVLLPYFRYLLPILSNLLINVRKCVF